MRQARVVIHWQHASYKPHLCLPLQAQPTPNEPDDGSQVQKQIGKCNLKLQK